MDDTQNKKTRVVTIGVCFEIATLQAPLSDQSPSGLLLPFWSRVLEKLSNHVWGIRMKASNSKYEKLLLSW